VWNGHCCPLPLTLILIFACHPEEAESHAKRATPDEGPMHVAGATAAAWFWVERRPALRKPPPTRIRLQPRAPALVNGACKQELRIRKVG
jgi:hypothetical protein